MPLVELAPEPTIYVLLVFKSPVSVQDVPSQDSAAAPPPEEELPPNAKASVLVPKPPIPPLPVFKLLTSVQLEPFQVSVSFLLPGFPPKAKAAV